MVLSVVALPNNIRWGFPVHVWLHRQIIHHGSPSKAFVHGHWYVFHCYSGWNFVAIPHINSSIVWTAEFLWLYACVEVRILYIFVRYCCGRHILLCTCRVPFRSYISFCVSMKVCCFVLICNSLCLLFCNSMSELNDQCISYTCDGFMVAHNFNCGTMALQMVLLLVLRWTSSAPDDSELQKMQRMRSVLYWICLCLVCVWLYTALSYIIFGSCNATSLLQSQFNIHVPPGCRRRKATRRVWEGRQKTSSKTAITNMWFQCYYSRDWVYGCFLSCFAVLHSSQIGLWSWMETN